jgi:cyanophycinase
VGDGKLCVVSVASAVGDELYEIYHRAFKKIGVKKISHLDVIHRSEQVDLKALKAVKDADAIFFTGGDQLRITSEMGGTLVAERIQEIYEHGGVIGGTSAGASVMGQIMMVSGSSEKSFRIGNDLKLAPGLGFIPSLLIDQHFAERGRIGRLIVATAHNPRYLGVGIDENTAIIVHDENRFEVIGEGAVYVLDGHESTCINISENELDRTLSIFNIRMHVLSERDQFDISKRIPEKHPADEIKKAAI